MPLATGTAMPTQVYRSGKSPIAFWYSPAEPLLRPMTMKSSDCKDAMEVLVESRGILAGLPFNPLRMRALARH
jgi:hypothetical protein